ncbi:hypothetical protein B0H17DRAFT_1174450 [Mycena rosella]|uniref:Zn(2)-C6 fungal-type domain-containing protein n=1 Tax=Mycena rosella TaxID=1033263 RepID=A0AAD7GXJ8_MYCRO|nr:hypothetical protein B0H17DRAFT_1174450 [Mycena rosella]
MKPFKFKTPTCALCRRRKLRCDGGSPCGPCSRTRTPVTCTYVLRPVGQLRSELPKGGACIACRQRKRRCDGNLPCRTCKQGSRPDGCQYREKTAPAKPKPPKATRRDYHVLFDSASTSSSSSYRPAIPPQIPTQNSGTLRLEDEYSDYYDHLDPWADLDPTYYSSYPPGSTSSSESLSPLPTFLDSISPSSLESLPLDAELSSFVTTAKRQALSIGDMSGLTVDPTLVNVCQLLGYLIKNHSYSEAWLSANCQTTAEAELYVLIRDQLDGVSGLAPDPLVCLQACTLLVMYCCWKEDILGAQEFLLRASNLFVLHAATLDLEDASAVEWCPQFDISYLSPRSVAAEVRAAFCHVVYLELIGTVAFDLDPIIDPGLMEKFRRLAASPSFLFANAVHRSDTEINFIRTQALLFLSDSRKLVASWNQWDLGDPSPSTWSKSFWSLIEDVHAHLNLINTTLMDVIYIPEPQGALCALKTCAIMCLAALAEAYGLFAASQLELREKHRDAVGEIATITDGFSDADYQYLHPLLSICWSIACRNVYQDTLEVGDLRFGTTHCRMFVDEWNRKLRRASPFAFNFSYRLSSV